MIFSYRHPKRRALSSKPVQAPVPTSGEVYAIVALPTVMYERGNLFADSASQHTFLDNSIYDPLREVRWFKLTAFRNVNKDSDLQYLIPHRLLYGADYVGMYSHGEVLYGYKDRNDYKSLVPFEVHSLGTLTYFSSYRTMELL